MCYGIIIKRNSRFAHSDNFKPKDIIFTKSKCRLVILIQGDSFARGPKLLSIKNYVIEVIN